MTVIFLFLKSIPFRAYLITAAITAGLAFIAWSRFDAARDERIKLEIEMVRQARERIILMETNNADFRRMAPRERCLHVMRDSGLRPENCD